MSDRTVPPSESGVEALRFRKRPVEVEAIQFTASGRGVIRRTNRDEVAAFLGFEPTISPEHMGQLGIPTPEGTMWASLGDWIVRGVKGECYPVKPDIFAATYEERDDARPA